MTARLPRAVARVALAATLAAVFAGRADAQAPQCADDFLSAYLVSGFECRIRGVTFSNFSYGSTILAALNATVEEHSADEIAILPVRANGFGFSFLEVPGLLTPGNHVEVDTDAPVFDGHIVTVFSFDFTSPLREIRRAGFGGFVGIDKPLAPGSFADTASISGDVRGPAGVCLDDETRTRTAQGESYPERADRCTPDRLLSGTATFTFETRLVRDGTRARPAIGFAESHLHYAAFAGARPSVVPEPATVTLLAVGLAGVAGVTARRRRRE